MSQSLPILLIPGLACTSRLYEAQLPALWQIGPVTVTNHTGAGSMAAVAQSILAHARPRFHMVGLSMGGYVAFEILRQAPARVARLALLDTGSRADAPEQTERRKKLIAIAEKDRLTLVNELLWPLLFHESRMPDAELRAIADAMLLETGAENFVLQQQALMSRPDSRSGLGSIVTAIDLRHQSSAMRSLRGFRGRNWKPSPLAVIYPHWNGPKRSPNCSLAGFLPDR